MTTSMKDIFERFWAHITNKIDAKLSEVSEFIDNLTYSWNDLTDKPFYETNEVTSVILEEQTFEVHLGGTGSNYNVIRAIKTVGYNITELLVNGETYKVTLNGVEYICTAYRGGFGLVLGEYDTSDLEHRETLNYPFSFSTTLDVIDDIVVDDTITVKIEHGNFGVKQLDEKYIPETIARVEDIPEGLSGSWNDLTDKPFSEIVEQGVLCEDMSWNGIIKYNITVGKWRKCDELIPNILDVVNKLSGIENTIVGYENKPGYLAISEDNRVVYGYEENTLRYLIILENNVTTTVESEELTFTNSGFYVNTGVEGTYPVTYNYTQLKTLDEKFIPDTIVRQSALEAYETEIVDKVLSALPTWNGGVY